MESILSHAPLTLGEVKGDARDCASRLVGETAVGPLELLEDRAQRGDQLQCDVFSDKGHGFLLSFTFALAFRSSAFPCSPPGPPTQLPAAGFTLPNRPPAAGGRRVVHVLWAAPTLRMRSRVPAAF